MPRPPLSCSDSYGMPSGHATLAGILICSSILMYKQKLSTDLLSTIVICLYAINMAYSRIYLNYELIILNKELNLNGSIA